MNKYLVVRMKSDWARRHILQRMLSRAEGLIPFEPDRIHYYRFGDVLVFSAESTEVGGYVGKDHVDVDGNGVLLYDGTPLMPAPARSGRWAAALRTHLSSMKTEEVFRRVRGTYNLTYVDGESFTAFSDYAGYTPLFFLDDDDVCAVSNRQLLLARVARCQDNIAFNYAALSWLPGQANIIGADTVFAGVKLLQPGTYLQSTAEVTRTVELPKVWDGVRAPVTPADYDEITEGLLEHTRSMSALPFQKLTMSLTGGKDTRLVLGLAIGSGLIDRVDDTFTYGREGSPEVEVAQHVAAVAGVPHRAQVTNPEQFDLEKAWWRLRYHVFRFEGSVCPWDGGGDPATTSILELHGWGAAALTRAVRSHNGIQLTNLSEAVTLFANYQQRTDPLDVQHIDVTMAQQEAMRSTVESWYREGRDLDDLIDVLHMRNRMPYWCGILAANTYAMSRLFPLIHFDTAKAAFRGGSDQRKTCRIHFEVLRRVNPKLVELPFLSTRWDPRLDPHLEAAGLKAASAFKPRNEVRSQNMVTWQWDFLDQGWDEIRAVLLDSPQSGLFDIVDRDRLEKVMNDRAAVVRVTHAKEILSLLAMQILMTGQFIALREGADVQPAYLTNITDLVCDSEGIRLRRTSPEECDLPTITFEIPAAGLLRLRIDPTDRSGTFVLGRVWLTLNDRTIIVSGDGRFGLTPSRQVAHRRSAPRATVYEALGTDPQFVLQLPAEGLDINGVDTVRLHVETASVRGGRAVAYFDSGHGMSERWKVTTATPYLRPA
ncbi:hypothetical protein [Actinopolymorpha sp. B9G3]|uniref:hypothetical protein n=1 Tax=Actinopolymorpha sp. B9G3 TaxID=3158970 RepID=UPI0032D9118C